MVKANTASIDVKSAIITALRNDPNNQHNVKSLGKSIMSDFKKECKDKDERKALFAQEIKCLVDSGLVLENDGYVYWNSNNDDEADKPPKKRKLSEASSNSDSESDGDKKSTKKASKGPESSTTEAVVPPKKEYPVPTGNNTILLFYAYCDPQMTRGEQDIAISRCYKTLTDLGMTGRLRVGREGFNCTLTGHHDSVRKFTAFLKEFQPKTFAHTDFKCVDNLPDQQLLKGLKVFPVTEIVTYGFNPSDAPLDMRGTHLTPQEFHKAMANPNAVMIDVRNFNESLIGKFAPPSIIKDENGNDVVIPADKVLDPCMRKSTEFPGWIDDNRDKLEGKQILMYCTAGVRCERASAFMRNKGIENVYQLEGGIHRYLDAYPDDGGYWVGKNYTFDKRFNHGAKTSETISHCVVCEKLWDRYQAQLKCYKCSMEVLVCKDCQKTKPGPAKNSLFCPLCKPVKK